MSTTEFRAYDLTTGFRGPVRATAADAANDCIAHNAGCEAQGGYGSAVVVYRDGDYMAREDSGEPVWPSHGRSSGAVRWQ